MNIVEAVKIANKHALQHCRKHIGLGIISVSHEFTHGVTQDSEAIVTRVTETGSLGSPRTTGIYYHEAFLRKLNDLTLDNLSMALFVGFQPGSGAVHKVDGRTRTTFSTVVRPVVVVGDYDRLRRHYPIFKLTWLPDSPKTRRKP